MNNNLSKILKQSYNYPENQLSLDIWNTIDAKISRNSKIKSISYSILGVMSLGCFAFLSIHTKEQFSSSGFFQYASLAFSDSSILTLYWKEYLLSLADSVPFATLGALSFLLFSMLISIKKSVFYYKNQLLKV